MRKMIFNRWFFLAAFLTLSLSAFSFMAYKQAHSTCNIGKSCCQSPVQSTEKGEMILEAVSKQFTSFISIQ